MRTPGHDRELALGFLFGEGLIDSAADVSAIEPCGPVQQQQPLQNIVRVSLAPGVSVAETHFDRHFAVNSSCGLCGKQTLAALERAANHTIGLVFASRLGAAAISGRAATRASRVRRDGQLHAAALFEPQASCCSCVKTSVATMRSTS